MEKVLSWAVEGLRWCEISGVQYYVNRSTAAAYAYASCFCCQLGATACCLALLVELQAVYILKAERWLRTQQDALYLLKE